jgi:hypothetical protein
MPPLFCPTLDHALKGEFEIETQHANAHLPLYGMGDAPAFVAKRRCTPSIVCLPLLTYLRHTNTRLSFITKVGTSPILNKLRHAENWASLFYPPPSQVHASVMRAWLDLPDRRRSPVGASLICVSYLSFICSAHYRARHLRFQMPKWKKLNRCSCQSESIDVWDNLEAHFNDFATHTVGERCIT